MGVNLGEIVCDFNGFLVGFQSKVVERALSGLILVFRESFHHTKVKGKARGFLSVYYLI